MTNKQMVILVLLSFLLIPVYYLYIPLFDECKRYPEQDSKSLCDAFQQKLNKGLYWDINHD